MTNLYKLKTTNDLLFRMQRQLVRISLPPKVRAKLSEQILQLNELLNEMSDVIEDAQRKEEQK